MTPIVSRLEVYIFLLHLHVSSPQCSLFSVSECHPDLNEVILTVSGMPSEGGGLLCQEVCGVQEDCSYWSYDSASLTCSLLSYCYLHSCDSFMAGPEPDFTACLCQADGSCADFVREDCVALGSVLWQSEAVRDAHQCQEYLQVRV